jgi:hypothetical protein
MRFGVFAVLTLAFCNPISAQTTMFEGFLTTPGTGVIDTMRFDNLRANLLAPTEPAETTNQQQGSETTTNPALLRFTPNLATRQRNLAGFIAKTRTQSPESADEMAQLFASTDVFAAMSQALAPKGLRIDNVADAFAVYWITAWETSRGIVGKDTSRELAQSVKAQVSRALLATPDFVAATAAQKQEMAEALLIQTALISASAEAAANDPGQLAAVGNAVRKGAQGMGLDLDAMELGDTGFKPGK